MFHVRIFWKDSLGSQLTTNPNDYHRWRQRTAYKYVWMFEQTSQVLKTLIMKKTHLDLVLNQPIMYC